MSRIVSILGGAAALALLSSVPTPTLAQNAATPERGDVALQLEEITVSARRREERLQDLPIAVTAFTADNIERQGLRDITDVAQFTPGFSMQNVGSTTEQPFIRGMSVTSFSSNLQTASSFQDGVYSTGLGRTVFFDDLERIEIIKGPQAALFGRATFAGAINYITKRPSFEPEGSLRVAGGQYGLLETHGSYSGPLFGDKLAFRVSGNTRNYDGSFTNPLGGKKFGVERRSGYTVGLTYKPTDALELNFHWLDTQFRDLGQTPIYMQPASTLNCYPNAMGVFTYYCGEVGSTTQYLGLNFDQTNGAYTNLDQQRVVFDANYDAGPIAVTLISSYLYQNNQTFCDCDYSPLRSFGGAFTSLFDTSNKNQSHELRIQTTAEGVRWMGGVYWFRENSVTGRVNVPTPPILPFVTVTNKAVFGSVSIPFAERFTLDLDARYYEEQQQRTAIRGNRAVDVKYTQTLPRAILNFQQTPDQMFYVSASRGAQPGQFNTGENIPQDLVKVDEETMWSYELGSKSTWLDRKLALNASLYYIDWSNQVYRAEVASSTGELVNVLANLGGSEIKGLELEGAWQLSKAFGVRLGYAYIDARYTDFVSAVALAVYRNSQVSGKQLPNTPKNTITASLSYRAPIPALQSFEAFGQFDYQWRGKQTLAEVDDAYIGAMNLANLRLGVDNGKLQLSVAVENLLDDDTPDFATRFSDLNTSPFRYGYLVGLREPRRWSATATYRF